MDQMVAYDANSAIAATARDTYITANPLTAGTELEQINTQYWIASFFEWTRSLLLTLDGAASRH